MSSSMGNLIVQVKTEPITYKNVPASALPIIDTESDYGWINVLETMEPTLLERMGGVGITVRVELNFTFRIPVATLLEMLKTNKKIATRLLETCSDADKMLGHKIVLDKLYVPNILMSAGSVFSGYTPTFRTVDATKPFQSLPVNIIDERYIKIKFEDAADKELLCEEVRRSVKKGLEDTHVKLGMLLLKRSVIETRYAIYNTKATTEEAGVDVLEELGAAYHDLREVDEDIARMSLPRGLMGCLDLFGHRTAVELYLAKQEQEQEPEPEPEQEDITEV